MAVLLCYWLFEIHTVFTDRVTDSQVNCEPESDVVDLPSCVIELSDSLLADSFLGYVWALVVGKSIVFLVKSLVRVASCTIDRTILWYLQYTWQPQSCYMKNLETKSSLLLILRDQISTWISIICLKSTTSSQQSCVDFCQLKVWQVVSSTSFKQM